jgi:hypothetical protein
VFEFFGDLVGAEVFNPVRRMTGKVVANPAAALATAKGFDLVVDLETIANIAEGTPEFQSVEQRLIELVPAVRKVAGVSHLISDQDVLNAICQPDQPLAIEPLLDGLTEQQQIDCSVEHWQRTSAMPLWIATSSMRFAIHTGHYLRRACAESRFFTGTSASR